MDATTDEDILGAAASVGLLQLRAGGGAHLLAALSDPEAEPEELARLVETEPGLAARVLRVANSTFYGLSRSVSTIERAMVVLGADAVRGIAAASCMDRALMRGTEALAIDLGTVVRHSIGTALVAQKLAQAGPAAQAGEAFVAGLLHNLGVPIQARLDPEGIRAVIEALAADPRADLRAIESRHARIGHEHCAAVLLTAWKLPATLVDAGAYHHDPSGAPDATRTVVTLVHVAAGIAARALPRPAAEPEGAADDAACLESLGISAETAEAAAANLSLHVAALAGH